MADVVGGGVEEGKHVRISLTMEQETRGASRAFRRQGGKLFIYVREDGIVNEKVRFVNLSAWCVNCAECLVCEVDLFALLALCYIASAS